MEEQISLEEYLFGEGNKIFIDDIEFCVDRIVMLPKIRPHQLEKAVDLSVEYCKYADFRLKILKNIYKCPVLIYRLYKRGFFVFDEVEPFLEKGDSSLFCYYFRKEIKDFKSFIQGKKILYDLKPSFFENESNIDQYIEYGFLPSSIEYCLKYDVLDDLVVFDDLKQNAKWCPFEWSFKPEYLDLLSFAGFFASIKCFRHLLMKGFEINENVFLMVVCGGCFDLFHLCQGKQFFIPSIVCKASEFFHLPLLVFMLENGANINANCKKNWTPLHYAANNGHISVVEYLVNQQADINPKSGINFYETPFHFAAENGHLSVVNYLVNQKVDINTKDYYVEFLYSIGLLFIKQFKMTILVLLNILLIKKLI